MKDDVFPRTRREGSGERNAANRVCLTKPKRRAALASLAHAEAGSWRRAENKVGGQLERTDVFIWTRVRDGLDGLPKDRLLRNLGEGVGVSDGGSF